MAALRRWSRNSSRRATVRWHSTFERRPGSATQLTPYLGLLELAISRLLGACPTHSRRATEPRSGGLRCGREARPKSLILRLFTPTGGPCTVAFAAADALQAITDSLDNLSATTLVILGNIRSAEGGLPFPEGLPALADTLMRASRRSASRAGCAGWEGQDTA